MVSKADMSVFRAWAEGEIKTSDAQFVKNLRSGRLSAVETLFGTVESLLRATRSGDAEALVEYMTKNGFKPGEISSLFFLGDRIATLEKEMPDL